MPTPTEQAVTEYFAAIRAMDPTRWVATFAPEAISHDPVGAPPMKGHEALHAFLTGITTSFKTVDLTEQSVHLCGLSAAIKWTGFVDTHTGKHVVFEGIDVIDCNETGKITHVRAFWDPSPVMASLDA